MSGRAGRRGKDERGICIIMVDDKVRSMLTQFGLGGEQERDSTG